MNFYSFHLGDYASHTAHLEPMEDLAYRRMLDLYYRTEVPLPREIEQIARLIRMKGHEDAVSLVVGEFFEDCCDGWMHARCDAEIAKMQDKQAKAKASAQASVNARSANAQRTLNERSTKVELPIPIPIPIPIPKEEEISNLTVASTLPAEEVPALALVPSKAAKPKPPDCPHLEVLALWGEVLPAMPQHLPSQWGGTRQTNLRARWRETAVEKGWVRQEEGIEYLRNLFAYVGRSPFLTGRVRPKSDGRPFVIELEWLVNPNNWAKVLEGKYHQEAA